MIILMKQLVYVVMVLRREQKTWLIDGHHTESYANKVLSRILIDRKSELR